MNDYERAKNSVSTLTKFYLGQEVETEFGVGIIVNLEMSFNGLYVSPESSKVTVWFSTEGAKEGWVSHNFSIYKIKPLLKDIRKQKLKKLENEH